jgi:hypothetical protein
MGARHPQDVIKATGASHYDFIVACNYLIRKKTVKTPADAIRYFEENDVSVEDTIEECIQAIRSHREAELAETPDELR